MINALKAYDGMMKGMARDLFPEAYVVFITPDKTISSVLARVGQVDRRNNLIAYPIVTVQRVGYPEYDMTRFLVGRGRYGYRGWSRDVSAKIATMIEPMVPVKLTYQWDVLVEGAESGMGLLNDMLVRLLQELDAQYVYSVVDFGEAPYESMRVAVMFDGIVDNSDLEPAGPEGRRLRATVNWTVDGLVPRGWVERKTVEALVLDEEVDEGL